MYLKKIPFYLLLVYIVNFYLVGKIIFGMHGLFEIQKKKIELMYDEERLMEVVKLNEIKRVKSSLLNDESVNLRYLEEIIVLQYNMIYDGQKVIILKR